jgi:hypothetical protein
MASAKHDPVRSPESFLVFGSPQLGDDATREVLDRLDSDRLESGPEVAVRRMLGAD